LKPESAAVQNKLASALLKIGQTGEAMAHSEKAVALAPDAVEFRFSLAGALAQAGRFSDAIGQLQKSIDIGGGRDWQSYDMLGAVYSKMGRQDDAIQAGRRALELALPVQDGELVRNLRAKLASYEQAHGR
jgi:Flp pilus assembly protein TadD